jgi:hypothetical protein
MESFAISELLVAPLPQQQKLLQSLGLAEPTIARECHLPEVEMLQRCLLMQSCVAKLA